jgi:hypothetical protein
MLYRDVSDRIEGFSIRDATGNCSRLDVDFSRAAAAAALYVLVIVPAGIRSTILKNARP